MCGGKHGWKVGSIRHAHRARSVQPATHMRYALTERGEQILSCSVTNYRGSDFHLAFYVDLVFIIVPQAAVPLRTIQTRRIIYLFCQCVPVCVCVRVCVCVSLFTS